MAEYYVALSKRCERALTVEANSLADATQKALAQMKDEGDYDYWTVDEAYAPQHKATANQ